MSARPPRRLRIGAALLCLILIGCAAKPFLLDGDANSAEVGYGLDLAAATAVAKEHCARYERVPQFLESGEDVAYFACVHP